MKALATSIALLILLIILLSVLIPFFIIIYNTPYYSNQGGVAAQAYQQQKELELNNVEKGNPIIYYSSGTSPYVEIKAQTVSTPLNITQIYYFYNGQWIPVLNSSLILYLLPGNQNIIPLPKQAFNQPIILVSGLANIYFLNPNTSITTSTISGPTGKIPIYITSFAYNKTSNSYNIIPVSVPVQFASSIYNTPFILYVNPGTYSISAKEVEVYLSQYGLTGKFAQWSLAGYGSLSSPNAASTLVTITGPTVLTLIYNVSLQKFNVKIVFSLPNGQPIPIGSNTTDPNTGATLTNVNSSMTVYVDSKPYQINYENYVLNLTLTYGYHFINYSQVFNLVFNYSYSNFFVPYGEMIKYTLKSITSNAQGILICNPYEIDVMSNGTVYVEFQPITYYYLVLVNNSFSLPSNVQLVSNSTPVLGDIAGQQLNVTIITSNSSQAVVLGPTKAYTYEKLYLSNGTEISVNYVYLHVYFGNFTLEFLNSFGYVDHTYISLIAEHAEIPYTVYNVLGLCASPSSFLIISPTYITVYEIWEWGELSNG
ncbi:hypothetical protein [Sulfurisphaera ohwakuensis]|uniref:Uncharacterized protein n=1 Tax=Sulfurisphaera ohwakuensis TaxID=69656 RepID=A0A650CFS5_SULOH|nr:hypothetical protein [Sulfurisphaera ohwakuensis]MBB5254092.1 hypothetical protein [Sulfurisphaera ohwakuensis]QGR16684.1 hypothetical protein D1869_05410 [Sulfurisphaera ohwakuensis]